VAFPSINSPGALVRTFNTSIPVCAGMHMQAHWLRVINEGLVHIDPTWMSSASSLVVAHALSDGVQVAAHSSCLFGLLTLTLAVCCNCHHRDCGVRGCVLPGGKPLLEDGCKVRVAYEPESTTCTTSLLQYSSRCNCTLLPLQPV
jgi:hypothetical protein